MLSAPVRLSTGLLAGASRISVAIAVPAGGFPEFQRQFVVWFIVCFGFYSMLCADFFLFVLFKLKSTLSFRLSKNL